MFRRIGWIAGLTLFLLLSSAAYAQGPQPQNTDPAWQGSYWNNKYLNGAAALTRSDTDINFDWGDRSPAPSIQADEFSARWTRTYDVAAGDYTLTSNADDGIRVWIDGNLVIDDWSDHPAHSTSVVRTLAAGHHQIQVDYYENAYNAVAQFSFTASAPTITEWRGEYYNNTDLSRTPALVRNDSAIAFNWGARSPAPGVINADYFSVRWTRNLSLAANTYRFTVTADDGVRLTVNGHLLIDHWTLQPPTTYSGVITLPSGNIPVELKYFENTYGAVASLSWAVESQSGRPTVIVDNSSGGFTRGGSSTGWHWVGEGYGGSQYWTWNNDWARANYNWARWYPSLSAGRYEVFAFIPDRYTTTSSARYWVSHAGGFTLRVVNQDATGGQWVSLGTYNFRGTSQDYVSLSDVTGETRLSHLIAFDAVKWEPR